MSIRTSSRSTKGQNKYLQSMLEEEPEPYYKGQQNGAEKANEDDDNEDGDEGIVRCPVCGTNDDNYDAENDAYGDMVQCDGCNSWQHIRCMTNGQDSVNCLLDKDGKYHCDQCDPSRYSQLSEHENQEFKLNNEDTRFMDDNFDDHNDEDDDEPVGGKRRRSRQQSRRSVSNGEGDHSVKRKKSLAASDDREGEARLRQNALKMFNDLFSKYIIPDTIEAEVYQLPNDIEENQDLADNMSKNLESELYEACLDKENNRLGKFYPEKVRSIFSNLKDKKNLTLKTHVVNGSLPLSKLATMSAQELANPDLQAFKEKVDSQSLDQLIIEQPNKPRWVKTHKGEELIEDENEFQENDMIYAKHVVTHHEEPDINIRNVSIPPGDPLATADQPDTKQEPEKVVQKEVLPDNNEVRVSYPEIDNEFLGNVTYLGSSKELENNPYKTAFGDAQLFVEGRLSRGKVLSYLHETQSSRTLLLYELIPKDDWNMEEYESAANFKKMHSFLINNDKIIGIKNKRRYEKNIYLIPSEGNESCFAIESILEKNNSRSSLSDNEKKLYLLVLVKPELLSQAR